MTRDSDLSRPLHRQDLSQNPFDQFETWLQEARADAGIPLPEAMALATASSDGAPSVRVVMLRGYDQGGFVFYTSTDSPKAGHLADNPRAELLFYWGKLERQVRIAGTALPVSREEAGAYFRSRPRDHNLAAMASEQSRVIGSRAELVDKLEALREEYGDEELPVPPDWGGYRLSPDTFEFWQGQPSRLHDRFRYTRQADGGWQIERLAP